MPQSHRHCQHERHGDRQGVPTFHELGYLTRVFFMPSLGRLRVLAQGFVLRCNFVDTSLCRTFRRIATRYEKRGAHYLGMLIMASIVLWL
jgi:hypothetical protein